MAPPRKPPEPGQKHPVHLRFPTDVFERIDAKATATGIPINRVVINEIAAFPYLERQTKLSELITHMETTLAKYGSRFTQTEVSESLLRAVDDILAAQTAAQRDAPIDRLRIFRRAMLESERRVARMEREQLAGQIKMLERQIAAIAALPDSALDRDRLPGLQDELARLQHAVVVADGK